MRIEYLTIFEANKANRLLEERRRTLIERDHHFGVTRFEVTKEEKEYLKKNGVKFVDIESECCHYYRTYSHTNGILSVYCAGCGELLCQAIDPQGL